jgi:hypothetical protein
MKNGSVSVCGHSLRERRQYGRVRHYLKNVSPAALGCDSMSEEGPVLDSLHRTRDRESLKGGMADRFVRRAKRRNRR